MATSPRDKQLKFEPWTDPHAKPFVQRGAITKKFGEFVAVDDVTLDIYQEEIFCLLGGSGCGKTTLLRMLAGFERPTSGKVFIDGLDVTNMPPYEQAVNMMFQSYALFPHMTVEQNVAFGLKQRRVTKPEITTACRRDARHRQARAVHKAQAAPALRRSATARRAGARPRQKPKLLLLDEPLAALDKKLREHTQFELINIQETLGVTFIVVTHDQEEAMTLSSRIGVMNHGEIVQVGTPSEIYEYPEFALRRGVHRLGEHVRGPADRGRARLRAHPVRRSRRRRSTSITASARRPGRPYGWRSAPRRCTSAGRSRPPRTTAPRAWCADIAYMGDLSIYLLRLDTGKVMRVTQPNVFRHADDRITWDETCLPELACLEPGRGDASERCRTDRPDGQ